MPMLVFSPRCVAAALGGEAPTCQVGARERSKWTGSATRSQSEKWHFLPVWLQPHYTPYKITKPHPGVGFPVTNSSQPTWSSFARALARERAGRAFVPGPSLGHLMWGVLVPSRAWPVSQGGHWRTNGPARGPSGPFDWAGLDAPPCSKHVVQRVPP